MEWDKKARLIYALCVLDAIFFLSPCLHPPPPFSRSPLISILALFSVQCPLFFLLSGVGKLMLRPGNGETPDECLPTITPVYCGEGTPDLHSVESYSFLSLLFTKDKVSAT